MGGQRQSLKGGGYVGGFLQLFDWNAKSRKKLFSNNCDHPDQSKQKKRCDGNLPMTRCNLAEMDVDEYVSTTSFKGSSDYSYSCASSITDEEGFGSKAPNVVARLMGLDTMPTSKHVEPFSTPFPDSQSLRESKYIRDKLQFHPEKGDIYCSNSRNKPTEKFQSEILHPKSVKTIPITCNKLLSPIKSHGFVSSNNATQVMEAAAKIIERGPPQASTSKTKIPSVGKSSVPFKVRELREKVEVSQKPSKKPAESNTAKIPKGQSMNKRLTGLSEDHLGGNNKGKSISLAIQAKVNVQKREGRKELNEVALNQSNSQRSAPKKSFVQNKNGALKQNNQKQNCPIDKEKLNSKSSLSNSQIRLNTSSGDSSLGGRYKNSRKSSGKSKVGSRKLSPEANDSKEEVLYSRTKTIPQKRKSLDGNYNKDKGQIVDNVLIDTNDKKKGTDVVSFTFTAPLSRQNNVFGSDYISKNSILNSDNRNNGKLSLMECDKIGADDLSILLEQKLRELTDETESSTYRASFSAPIFQNVSPTSREVSSMDMDMEMSNGNEGLNFTSTRENELMTKFQGTVKMEECRSDDTETRKSLHNRHPSPRSVLDLSFMAESWNSSETAHSIDLEGSNSKQGSSVQALEVLGMNSYTNPYFMEIDTELADSASSSSIKAPVFASTTGSNMDFQYVNKILSNVELMFKDFALGKSHKIINPHLLDQLENRIKFEETSNENKLENKVLFDCVSECMDLRFTRYTNMGFKLWGKGLSTVRRKEHLADDVYKEILGWKARDDTMVDDLVDKDMSSRHGKWIDFEVEAFELGVGIESRILNSLINEVVKDLVIR